MIFLIIN